MTVKDFAPPPQLKPKSIDHNAPVWPRQGSPTDGGQPRSAFDEWAPLNNWARRRVLRRMECWQVGRLQWCEGEQVWEFGQRSSDLPPVRVEVRSPQFYRLLLLGGDLGAAESYLQGHWETPDLVVLFVALLQNQDVLAGMGRGGSLVARPVRAIQRWLSRNTRSGSRRNIHAHYDLGNEFFGLFLDDTMTYSSGIFEQPGDSLRQASIAKYDRICRRLQLRPEHHVLEIGTGWGGFVQYAAEHYGCRVTSTTISREQYQFAQRRIAAAGLGDRVTLLQQDYRDLAGKFDRLVSIEMIEAVGHEFLPCYFQQCESLLKPAGEMMLQAITIPDQRYEAYRRSIDFIQHYVFPGGCLPSLGAIQRAVSSTRSLQLIELRDFAADYARTLSLWRTAFWQQMGAVQRLQRDERFVRMWDYYLAYCEAGFRTRMTGVAQLHFKSVPLGSTS